jgi:probable DNA metabolism protein
MRTFIVADFDDWRRTARALIGRGVKPSSVMFRRRASQGHFDWGDSAESLPTPEGHPHEPPTASLRVPPKFMQFGRFAACHRDDGVWNLIYSLLWRLTHGERHLLQDAADDEVRRFERMARSVSRDGHKMKAFVRFRKLTDDDGDHFVAWHRPDHRVVRIVAPFFSRRFTDMRWTIFTPDESAAWDGDHVSYAAGIPAAETPQGDELDGMWRTYYRSIFNPARIKLKAMRREMPARYWPALPETKALPDMLAEAPARLAEMLRHSRSATSTVQSLLPTQRDLPSLHAAAQACMACDLCRNATQTVFGRGPSNAQIMLVGEQPGDEEDRRGEPFVGPAGQLLRQSVAAAGLSWDELYVTNAVKHFHWEPRGERRLHKRPPARAISACRDWLAAEAAAVQPRVIVALGSTAAQAIFGRDSRLVRQRGVNLRCDWSPNALYSWHPSAVLRASSKEEQNRIARDLVDHLRIAKTLDSQPVQV